MPGAIIRRLIIFLRLKSFLSRHGSSIGHECVDKQREDDELWMCMRDVAMDLNLRVTHTASPFFFPC